MHPAWLTRTVCLSPDSFTAFFIAACTSMLPCRGQVFPEVQTKTWWRYWPMREPFSTRACSAAGRVTGHGDGVAVHCGDPAAPQKSRAPFRHDRPPGEQPGVPEVNELGLARYVERSVLLSAATLGRRMGRARGGALRGADVDARGLEEARDRLGLGRKVVALADHFTRDDEPVHEQRDAERDV